MTINNRVRGLASAKFIALTLPKQKAETQVESR
jgi:hypothetical protein